MRLQSKWQIKSFGYGLWAMVSGIVFTSGMLCAQGYAVKRVTNDTFTNQWPSVNSHGDMVWSRLESNGRWQIYKKAATATTPVLVQLPDYLNHDHRYPAIDDAGNLMYLKSNTGGNGTGLSVVLYNLLAASETTLEFSSADQLNGNHRDAGSHFGIAGNGTTISYYDFCCIIPLKRRFNVSGLGQLSGNFPSRDFPDINSNGTFVFVDGGKVYSARAGVAGPEVFVDTGTAPRISDEPSPRISYIQNGNVMVKTGDLSTPGAIVHSGSWADVSSSGTVVFEDKVNGVSQIFFAQPFQLIDPTSGCETGTCSLLSSGSLSTVPDVLAVNGKMVDGVAADGVSQLLLRWKTPVAGSASLDITGVPSVVGTLSTVSGDQTGSPLAVSTVSTTSGDTLFALYTSPHQFVRTDGTVPDRQVFVHVVFNPNTGPPLEFSVPIKIVRPPVLLVHGLWASRSDWRDFGELGNSDDDSRFFVRRANYPSNGTFQIAALKVYQDIKETLANFKEIKKIAAVQVNIVAHGMGAPVVRFMPLLVDFLNDARLPTFNRGPVSRLITIAGMHQGTGMANYLVDHSCVAGLVGSSLFQQLPFLANLTNGALREVATCSASMNQVNAIGVTTPFPVHTITSEASNGYIMAVESFLNAIGPLSCQDFKNFTMKEAVGTSHDLLVSTSSQRAGLPVNQLTEVMPVPNVVHSPPFSLLPFRDGAETSDQGIAMRAVELLDEANQSTFAPLRGSGQEIIISAAVEDKTSSIQPVGRSLQFSASVSVPNCQGLSFRWDFGDNTFSSLQNPQHFYQDPGTYTASVTATCSPCGQGTGTVVVTVVKGQILSMRSDQLNDGIEGNYFPSGEGTTRGFVLMGARGDGKGHAIAVVKIEPINPTVLSSVLVRFKEHGALLTPSIGAGTIVSVNGNSAILAIETPPLGAFVNSYDVVIGIDYNGDGQIDTIEQMVVSSDYFLVVPQLAYTASRITLGSAGLSCIVLAALVPNLLLPPEADICSVAGNFLLSFVSGSVPAEALAPGLINENDAAGQRLHHKVGVAFSLDGTAQFPQYVFSPSSTVASKIRSSTALTAKLTAALPSYASTILSYFHNNSETSHTFSGIVFSDPGIFFNSSDFDLGIAIGHAVMRNTSFSVTVLKDSNSGHLIVRNVVLDVGELIDIYDFNYPDGGLAALAAEVQAGYPTLGSGGKVFSINVQLQGDIPNPSGAFFDFGPSI